MSSGNERKPRDWWRSAAVVLALALLGSWAGLGYLILDGAISLDYCRSEQVHLKHDIRVLVEAAKVRLDASTLIEARGQIDPELSRQLDKDHRLGLSSVTLQFSEGGALLGLVPGGS